MNRDYIYDNGDDTGINYSDPDVDESIDDFDVESLRGTIDSGECIYCGSPNAMKHDDKCFICEDCNRSIHEDLYYRWVAGFNIQLEDDYNDIW